MLNASTAWRTTFQTLRQDFQRAADANPRLRHLALEVLDEKSGMPPHWQRAFEEAGCGSVGLMTAPWDQRRQLGHLYGPKEEVETFERLAERGWLALPGTPDGKAQAYPQMQPLERWLALVYRTLREHPGSYLSADDVLWVCYRTADGQQQELGFAPHWVTPQTPNGEMRELGYPQADLLPAPVRRWKVSALATDPFSASVVAIDMLLSHPDPEGPYLVSIQEADAYQKSPAFQNANFLVDAIALGEGRRFPIYRYWCMPVVGDTPSICPNADPPEDKRDREVLRGYLPRIAKTFRELGLVKQGQTIHWVGRQARLGTICRCFSAAAESEAARQGAKSDVPGEASSGLAGVSGTAAAAVTSSAENPEVGANPSVELFFSYSHKDEKLRDDLETHLSLMKNQRLIAGWHDRKIGAGTEWAGQIDKHLNDARIILLLVSADFIASRYCYDMEMKRAMERHENREARVIPIILKPCDWHSAPFGKLQALPTDGAPVTEAKNRDRAWTVIAKGIRAALTEMGTRP